jgi:hypothetical protein
MLKQLVSHSKELACNIKYDGLNEIHFENIDTDEALILEALMAHFYFKYQKGDVRWPKKFKENQKDTFPLTRTASHLYLHQSCEVLLLE